MQPEEKEIIFKIGDLVEWHSSSGRCRGAGVVSRVDYVWFSPIEGSEPRTRVYVLDEDMHTKIGRPVDFKLLSRATS